MHVVARSVFSGGQRRARSLPTNIAPTYKTNFSSNSTIGTVSRYTIHSIRLSPVKKYVYINNCFFIATPSIPGSGFEPKACGYGPERTVFLDICCVIVGDSNVVGMFFGKLLPGVVLTIYVAEYCLDGDFSVETYILVAT